MLFTFQLPFWAGLSRYVAELTGAFVCVSLGITLTVRPAEYIDSWLKIIREDNRAIVRAASAASKAADYLLALRPRSVGAANDDDDPDDRSLLLRPESPRRPTLANYVPRPAPMGHDF